jgi:hypothetical protein
MKKENLKNRIQCEYDGGFAMPKVCFSCGEAADDKKWQVTTTSFLRHRKFIINFPVCDACAQAHKEYINILPINIVGAVALVFTLFTLFFSDTNIPPVLFYPGGVAWIAILIWYLLRMNKKARAAETGGTQRARDIKSAVYFEKIQLPKKKIGGEAIVLFRNKRFAREFARLNKGKEIKLDH